MKLKTLLMIIAMLCISLFAVACGGGDDTTTAAGTDAPAATTTAKETTKKTTTKKTTTTKATTTTVTTTLAPDYMTKLPASLPNNQTFEIHTRIGLDTADDYLSIDGHKFTNMTWDAQGIYGGSCNFACDLEDGRAECTVSLADSISPLGMKGVMWYIDFSRVDPNTAKNGPCTSITLGKNTYRSNLGDGSAAGLGQATGYYYLNGEWVTTTNVNSCRMEVPHGFKGWVYVPLTSYNGAGELYDGTTGVGIEGKWINAINLYTDYYTYSDAKTLTFDEILFVG